MERQKSRRRANAHGTTIQRHEEQSAADYSTVLRVTAICSAFMLFCIYFVPRIIFALTFGHWVA